jgi:hypothetical protein
MATLQKPPRFAFSLRRLFAIIALTALIASGIAYISGESQKGWTVAKIDRLINAQIPLGCDQQQIESWLDKLGIRHNYTTETWEYMTANGYTMPTLAGLNPATLDGMIVGRIEGKDANVSLFFSGRISLFFFFDHKGAYVGHYIDKIVHGP